MKNEFNNIRDAATPSADFKSRLGHRLDAKLPTMTNKPKRRMAYAVSLASVALLLSGSGAYAYSSPNVTPDSPLYGVKTGIEGVQERFKKSPEARAKFHEKMAQRRGHELDRAKSPEAQAELRIRLAELLDMTQEELEGAKNDPELRRQIGEQVSELRRNHEIETFQERRAFMLERLEEAFENGEVNDERADMIRDRLNNAAPGDLHRLHEGLRNSEKSFNSEHFNMRDRFKTMHGLMEVESHI